MNSASITNSVYNDTTAWTVYYPQTTTVIQDSHIISGGAGVDYASPSGVKGKITLMGGKDGIHPKLYFNYVKSKFTKMEKEKLHRRIQKLRSMVVAADDMDQQALYENLATMLAIAVRESEAFVCGFDKLVQKKDVTKFIASVREKVVKFDELDNFPRLVPANVRDKIKNCKDKNIFDKYHILYADYDKGIPKLKTTKEKIRDKDPIVFGSFSFQEEILYFIGDWVDEYCDITLDKMVESLKRDDPEYSLKKVPELSDKSLKMLVQEVKTRHERLKGTRPSNYHDQMRQEDADNAKRKLRPNFLQRIIQKFSSI